MSSLMCFMKTSWVVALEARDLTYSFVYSKEWIAHENKFPLSLAMPLQWFPLGNRITLSFFENLLPEGDVLDAIARSHQAESPYEFLKEHGEDCA